MSSSLLCGINEEIINIKRYLMTLLLYVYHMALILVSTKVQEYDLPHAKTVICSVMLNKIKCR
jgi:hypothetical protein